MPRVCTSTNDPIDYCQKCFPTFGVAVIEFGHMGDGPDGRGNCFEHDTEHPDYGDDDFYLCTNCKKRLTSKDNFPKEM